MRVWSPSQPGVIARLHVIRLGVQRRWWYDDLEEALVDADLEHRRGYAFVAVHTRPEPLIGDVGWSPEWVGRPTVPEEVEERA